jgi:hypothetical protein
MRSQGRTERRALLALDGAEDMQGGYVQVSRAVQRTDFYLTVGPEPLERQEAHPHPQGQRVEPEQLLGRVLTRDGSKTLATDTPLGVDVRRLSTKQLREQRDALAALRASCPPDRSRELQQAQERAGELEDARQAALAEQQAATAALNQLRGRLLRRREQAAARDRLALAGHALRTVSGQAEQAAERVGVLRRAGQERAGWLEEHAELPLLERAVTRELGWRGRVDQQALALDPPGWLLAELGPVPADPQERRLWRVAAAELDGFRRAYGLDHPGPAKHRGSRLARDGWAAAPATPLAGQQADRPAESAGRRSSAPGEAVPPGGHGERTRPLTAHRDPAAAQGRYRVDAGRLLGAEPRWDGPGRRRDWQQVRAALQRLADYQHTREDRHGPHERAGHLHGRNLGRQERDGR